MFCYDALHYDTLRHTTSRHSMLCYATLCYATLRYVRPRNAMLYNSRICSAIVMLCLCYYVMLCYVMLRQVFPPLVFCHPSFLLNVFEGFQWKDEIPSLGLSLVTEPKHFSSLPIVSLSVCLPSVLLSLSIQAFCSRF